MESNEVEAITNPVLSAVEVNVLGTRNVVEAAVATGVARFLMISTDKAVNPTSVMGASKRVAELVVTSAGWEKVRVGEDERVRAGEGEQRHSSASQPPNPSTSQPLIPSASQPLILSTSQPLNLSASLYRRAGR